MSRWRAVVVIVALLAAPLCAGAQCPAQVPWTTFGGDGARTGSNPCETRLTPATVSGLHLLWAAPLKPPYAPGLSIAGGVHDTVFVADEHGEVQALDAATGAVLWKRGFGAHRSTCTDIPDGRWGTSAAPLLDLATGTGYLTTASDRVVAIDLATGRMRRGWRPVRVGAVRVDHVYSALTMANGRLYVATASYCDFGTYFGKVVAIDVATAQAAATWQVVPGATGDYGGGIWGPGGVAIDATGAVYAATGNSIPSENAGWAEQVVRLDASLTPQAADYVPLVGGDVDYGATPLLFQPPGCPAMLAAKNKSGVLVVFDRDTIASGPVQTLQIADVNDWQFNGIPAYSPDTNLVYVSNSSDSSSDVYQHGMVALAVEPGCTLGLAWQQTVGPNLSSVSPPTVAGGVVYYGDGIGSTLRAFDAQSGTPLWDSGGTIGGPIFAAPTVVDGRVFVAAWDGKIYAFGP